MKKFLPYILILIMLVGIFTPIARASSGENCSNHELGTKALCESAGSAWTPDNATTACSSLTGIGKIICQIHQILNSIIPVLVALGVVYFVWGIVQYMIGGDEEAKKKGRSRIIYGIIGLAVIVSVWGFVNIIVNTFGLGGQTPSLPTIGTSTGSCTLGTGTDIKFQHLLVYITCIISSSVIPLIFALATVMFVWGVVQFVINSDEEAKKEKGKQFMLWGIIALTVMVCVWGLVGILGNTFGIKTGFIPQVAVPKSP